MPEPEARRAIDIRVLKYAAPALLTTLACLQLFLGLNFGLTPWKGGGFGMFSTVDRPSARSVRVYLETDDSELPTKVPSWLHHRRGYVRSLPVDFRVRSLAVDLAAATWVGGDLLGEPGAGRLTVGGPADFFLVHGDPLQDPSALWRVWRVA